MKAPAVCYSPSFVNVAKYGGAFGGPLCYIPLPIILGNSTSISSIVKVPHL